MNLHQTLKSSLLFLIVISFISNVRAQSWVQVGEDLTTNRGINGFGGEIHLTPDGRFLSMNCNKAYVMGIIRHPGIDPESHIYELKDGVWKAIWNGDSIQTNYGLTISNDGLTMAYITLEQDLQQTNREAIHFVIHVLKRINEKWIPVGEPIFSLKETSYANSPDNVSLAMDAEGNSLAIGFIYAWENMDSSIINSGSVEVYSWQENKWIRNGQALQGRDSFFIGSYVNMSADGNRIAVRATHFSGNGGYVEVYQKSGDKWFLLGQPINIGYHFWNGQSSFSLSQDGKKIAVGGLHSTPELLDLSSFAVHQLRDSTWQPEDHIFTAAEDVKLGEHIQLSGNGNTLVCSYYEGGIPHLKVLRLSGNKWYESISTGLNCGTAIQDLSISYSGDTISVGIVEKSANKQLEIVRIYAWDEHSSIRKTEPIKCSVFPNPASDAITIVSNEFIKNPVVEIMNSTGQVIVFENLNSGTSFSLPLNLNPGLYYVRLNSDVISQWTSLVVR
ncbi:MAG: T9SS type A sorting domain-containing protein [Bacteroidetes bacterium]|nr:T9SS type A sorting domain-containing protein [Bacteroidota bacterium]